MEFVKEQICQSMAATLQGRVISLKQMWKVKTLFLRLYLLIASKHDNIINMIIIKLIIRIRTYPFTAIFWTVLAWW